MNNVTVKDYSSKVKVFLSEAVRKQVAEAAELLKLQAQQEAPVKTGNLRDSINAIPSATGYKVEASASYTGEVEFGTPTKQANPFFTRAIEKIIRMSKGIFRKVT
jgi:HK97 gp10 family phage protein